MKLIGFGARNHHPARMLSSTVKERFVSTVRKCTTRRRFLEGSGRGCTRNPFLAASASTRTTEVVKPSFPSSKPFSSSSSSGSSSSSSRPEMALIPMETHARNAALSATLFAFCFGVAYYSMYAVGQAGGKGADDPLLVLKMEAEAAREKQTQEQQKTREVNDMLKEFQAGGYDPDKLDEEETDPSSKTKKSWWKFW